MAIDEVESYPMIAGDGPSSYAKNSSYQKALVEAARELINKNIANKLDLCSLKFDTDSCAFRIADLGCSVGPNTFIAVQTIIEAVELKYHAEHQNTSALEFQVLFNDHTDNDFNTLFRTLPPRKYFAAGVPGSFHGCLFPKSTLHVVHSSTALQWLSRVPKELINEKASESKRRNIQYTGSAKEVVEAKSAQFRNDMESFLNARAEELVSGGLMLISFPAMPDGTPVIDTIIGSILNFIGSCLIEMARMGMINEEKAYNFVVPMYTPTPKEMESIIQRNGYFTIETMCEMKNPMSHRTYSAEFNISHIRAAMEGLVLKHFGDDSVDKIFNYFTAKLADNPSVFDTKLKNMDLFICLRRISTD
ncbi:S-adenosylmethionine-dependent methyltransferase [Melia azedarach]|uniref:S-adenosylmethionine-dependent methyltransferase n=1 Tax=Melia azedarach TaxID=155640 RepID=A0ACC1X7A0_MELAZ|nr:S-adenosylmethionine-dependent methyltransferase [Melia azedarach]